VDCDECRRLEAEVARLELLHVNALEFLRTQTVADPYQESVAAERRASMSTALARIRLDTHRRNSHSG
jgi:hypothetical protein